MNPPKPKGPEWEDDEKPLVEIWHGKDPRLQPQQKVQESADKSFNYLSVYWLPTQRFVQLATDEVRTVTPAPMDRWAVGYDDRAFELEASLSGVRKRDAYVIDLTNGSRRKVLSVTTASLSPSTDGQRFAYMEDGHYFVQEFAGGASRNLTAGVNATFWNDEDTTMSSSRRASHRLVRRRAYAAAHRRLEHLALPSSRRGTGQPDRHRQAGRRAASPDPREQLPAARLRPDQAADGRDLWRMDQEGRPRQGRSRKAWRHVTHLGGRGHSRHARPRRRGLPLQQGHLP